MPDIKTASGYVIDHQMFLEAAGNMPRVRSVLSMSEVDWNALKKRPTHLCDLLGVPRTVYAGANKNKALTVKALRNLYSEHKGWMQLDDADACANLLLGEVECKFCKGANNKSGTMGLYPKTLASHTATEIHKKCSQPTRKRQRDLIESGFEHERVAKRRKTLRDYAVGNFLTGGDGAQPVPANSLPQLFNQDFFILQRALRRGFPRSTCIRTSVMPRLITDIRERMAKLLEGKMFAIGIDGGSSNLCDGAKVLVITATSPELPYDIVLETRVLRYRHETGQLQAKLIKRVIESLPGIKASQVQYLVADNAAVNPRTAKVS